MELNERLRELRKEQGETQKQVAAAIGIGERPYQYLESGEHRPSLDTLIALADHFGVSLDYLAGRSDRRSCPKRKRAVHGPKEKNAFGRNSARACKVAVRGLA